MKRCPKCGEVKDAEGFYLVKRPSGNTHLSGVCKLCNKAASTLRMKNNPEKSRAYSKKHRETKPENWKATQKKYRDKNPDKRRALQKNGCETLSTWYLSEKCALLMNLKPYQVRQIPGLLEAYKLNIQLKRKLKDHATK